MRTAAVPDAGPPTSIRISLVTDVHRLRASRPAPSTGTARSAADPSPGMAGHPQTPGTVSVLAATQKPDRERSARPTSPRGGCRRLAGRARQLPQGLTRPWDVPERDGRPGRPRGAGAAAARRGAEPGPPPHRGRRSATHHRALEAGAMRARRPPGTGRRLPPGPRSLSRPAMWRASLR